MKTEAQIIAIAEAGGWTNIKTTPWLIGMDPKGRPEMAVPNYLGDRNAMHEALLTLDKTQQGEFMMHLEALGHFDTSPFEDLTAPLERLARAFLQVTNLWTDETPS